MKIGQQELYQIIKEEIQKVFAEQDDPYGDMDASLGRQKEVPKYNCRKVPTKRREARVMIAAMANDSAKCGDPRRCPPRGRAGMECRDKIEQCKMIAKAKHCIRTSRNNVWIFVNGFKVRA